MRLLLSALFHKSPFENLQRHADKVKECAQLFKEAIHCHFDEKIKEFEKLTDQVAKLESEADAIKRNIRNHLPKGILMPVDKFQLFQYLREQDSVMDEVEDALYWLSFQPPGITKEVEEDLRELVEAVLPASEKLPELVSMATVYFRRSTEQQRNKMKSLIRDIRQNENEADLLERELKAKIFRTIKDPLAAFFLIRLTDIVGRIADHAENASDRMRTMIAR